MKTNNVWNMTEGSPAKLLLRFSFPLFIGNIFQLMYSFVDSVVIGRFVGSNELGGIGCTGSIDFLFFSVGFGMSAGAGILTAVMFGAGEKEKLTRAIYNSFYVLFGASILIALSGYFIGPWVLRKMNTPDEVFPYAELYLKVISLGSVSNMFYGGISAVMRSFGDSKTPLAILVCACLANIGLDLLFVLVFDMGVLGVALATVLVQAAAAVCSYILASRRLPLFRYQKGAGRPDRYLIGRCIRLGLPIAGQNLMIAASCMVLQAVVNGFGPVMVTANAAVTKLDQIVQQPYSSLATALSTYTGQNIGAGRYDRVKAGLRTGMRYVVAVSAVMLIVFQFCGEPLLSLYVRDPEIIAVGVKALRITSCFYIFLGLLYVVRGVLNGAGDAFYSALNGVLELACRVGLSAPLTMIPFIGMWGCFLCSGLTWMITGVVSLIRYLGGHWKRHNALTGGGTEEYETLA